MIQLLVPASEDEFATRFGPPLTEISTSSSKHPPAPNMSRCSSLAIPTPNSAADVTSLVVQDALRVSSLAAQLAACCPSLWASTNSRLLPPPSQSRSDRERVHVTSSTTG